MSSAEPTALAEQTVSLGDARAFRQRATANGYTLIRVRTHAKSPLACAWQHGENSDALLDVKPDVLNTGLVLAGLRCIDVDVDSPPLVAKILDQAHLLLPSGALIRGRANSPRVALFYRAAEGQPLKRSINGPNGKIEHGQHPSGAALTWADGRGPDTVSLSDLPAASEEEIDNFLSACAPGLGVADAQSTGMASLEGQLGKLDDLLPLAPSFNTALLQNDLSAGIEIPHWFTNLGPAEKQALVKACLRVLDNRKEDPRETWLRVLFALGDAERLGCLDARQLALEWSRQGASWTGEADFETAWGSYKPKSSGVTVGTLLAVARDVGLNLSPWRDLALATTQAACAQSPASLSSPQLKPARSQGVAALPSTPAKRRWLHGIDLVRGAVSLLVAPGGRGKSSWLVALSLALASGRPLLGAHVFGGPLRVLLISAEDALAEVALRIRAAMKHHGLTDADVPGLCVVGADNWGLPLLCNGGSGPMLNVAGWDALTAELDHVEPDVLIFDPLMSVMGGASQNDNAAAALFMGQLVSVAAKRQIGIMVAHHASKGRDPLSAESAMGAASFVNLSRIALGIEPLAEKDAGGVGVLPREACNVFRVVGTKHNLTSPSETDRWFRLVSVEMGNAEPPTYPNGDKVGVVEIFHPGASGATFPRAMIRDALLAIDGAIVPLSPSKRATGRYAVPEVENAIAPHRGGRSSEIEAKAVIDHLIRSGLVEVDKIKVPRPGKGTDARNGLVLTSAGKRAVQNQPPQSPQLPATSMRVDAGGAPMGPPHRPRGYGGNAGGGVAGNDKLLSVSGISPALDARQAAHADISSGSEEPATAATHELLDLDSELLPASPARPSMAVGAPVPAVGTPTSPNFDDLAIPDFLDRRKGRTTA